MNEFVPGVWKKQGDLAVRLLLHLLAPMMLKLHDGDLVVRPMAHHRKEGNTCPEASLCPHTQGNPLQRLCVGPAMLEADVSVRFCVAAFRSD